MEVVSQKTATDVATQKVKRYVHNYEASKLACGMICLSCRKLSDDELLSLREHILRLDAQVGVQFFYDEQHRQLMILLDEQKLADTHFLSLGIKEYLQSRQLLESDMLVASFPENGQMIDQLLLGMRDELIENPGEGGELRIFHPAERASQNLVLIVDSDETVCQLLCARLEAKGYEVHIAHNGIDGIRLYEELSPDLVITELSLPILDGYQLMTSIQEKAAGSGDCKIIVLTDRRLEEDISKCFEQGVSDYLTKPFSPVELEVRMKRLFA